MVLRAGFVETDGDIAADRGPDSRKKHTGALIFASSGRNSQRRKVFSADGRQHVTNGVGFVHD